MKQKEWFDRIRKQKEERDRVNTKETAPSDDEPIQTEDIKFEERANGQDKPLLELPKKPVDCLDESPQDEVTQEEVSQDLSEEVTNFEELD